MSPAFTPAAAPGPGRGARQFFVERFAQLKDAAVRISGSYGASRIQQAVQQLQTLARRADRGLDPMSTSASAPPPVARTSDVPANNEPTVNEGGVETVTGNSIQLSFETKRCIHARFCVTGAPRVFLANVQGPWIHPDAMEVERLVEVAHACPSGAIRYQRLDGAHDERAPPVNLLSVRESGPYAIRGPLRIDGEQRGFRATLCRCGASKNKPFCDGSHHDVNFAATGEPPTGKTDMLPVRDGVLAIDPEPNGPLSIRGNLEVISGTGRVVARVTAARLCRCGGSVSKPFCDGTHAKIGFRSDI